MAAPRRQPRVQPVALLGPVVVAAGTFLPFLHGELGGFGELRPSLVQLSEWRGAAVLFAALIAAPALWLGARPLALAAGAIAALIVGFTAHEQLGWPGSLAHAAGAPPPQPRDLGDLGRAMRDLLELTPGLGLWLLAGGCALTLGAAVLVRPRR